MASILLSIDCSDNQLRLASGPAGRLSAWRVHAERLAPGQTASALMLGAIQDVLGGPPDRAQLGGIAVCTGPGAFTGLRLGVAVAQGLATALNIPCLALSSLLVHGRALMPNARALPVALDARLGERFLAWTNPLEGRLLSEVGLVQDQDVLFWFKQSAPAGLSADGVANAAFEAWHAQAPLQEQLVWALAELSCLAASRGDWVSAAALLPSYVRDRVAFTEQERQAGAGGNPSAARISLTGAP